MFFISQFLNLTQFISSKLNCIDVDTSGEPSPSVDGALILPLTEALLNSKPTLEV